MTLPLLRVVVGDRSSGSRMDYRHDDLGLVSTMERMERWLGLDEQNELHGKKSVEINISMRVAGSGDSELFPLAFYITRCSVT